MKTMPTPVASAPPQMTIETKDELCQIETTVVAERRAEIATMLRFAENFNALAVTPTIRVGVTPIAAAHRLQSEIFDIFGNSSTLRALPADANRPFATYVVEIDHGATRLTQQSGLVDKAGVPVQGLPAAVMAGDVAVAAAIWRGAFLAAGHLPDPGRGPGLEIVCPNVQAALALIASARRCGVEASHKERSSAARPNGGRRVCVMITEREFVIAMLIAMGAPECARIWSERWQRWQRRVVAAQGASNVEANVRRAARAGILVSARCERALEILGDDAPHHLIHAGRLRVGNRQASLDELGQMYSPVLSKDAVAGRIRRLLGLADKVAREAGIPDTAEAVRDLVDGDVLMVVDGGDDDAV